MSDANLLTKSSDGKSKMNDLPVIEIINFNAVK